MFWIIFSQTIHAVQKLFETKMEISKKKRNAENDGFQDFLKIYKLKVLFWDVRLYQTV